MLDLIKRFQWPIVAIAVTAAVAYVVVLGFGESLGVDPGVQATVESVLVNIRNTFATLILPVILKELDKNRNGVLDILEDAEEE